MVANGAALAREFRKQGPPVVLVNVAGGAPGRVEFARPAGTLPSDWTELVAELDVRADDILITKQRWGAFHQTALHDELQSRDVTQVVIGGIATSMGVESTARSAHEHGYHVVLVTDAMTDPNPQAHASSIELTFPKLGERTTTAEMLTLINEAPHHSAGNRRPSAVTRNRMEAQINATSSPLRPLRRSRRPLPR